MRKINNIKLPIMRIFALIFIVVNIFAYSVPAFAEHKISELFIESTGHNQHEAKIKAHRMGMFRALHLTADKLGLPLSQLERIPYSELKKIFKAESITKEVQEANQYNAVVTYSYNQNRIYQLLLKYGGKQIANRFDEYLIIPVFKRHDHYNIWNDEEVWNDIWDKNRDILKDHKLIYPEPKLEYREKINDQNLLNLDLKEFTEIFRSILFKNVIIITAEFFTDRDTGHTIVEVKTYIRSIGNKQVEVISKEYDLNSWSSLEQTVDNIIANLIKNYGVAITTPKNNVSTNFDIPKKPLPIAMEFEAYTLEDLDDIETKIEKISDIYDYEIRQIDNIHYKILIYSEMNEYDLAEALYLNNLSYKKKGSKYYLINIRKGA